MFYVPCQRIVQTKEYKLMSVTLPLPLLAHSDPKSRHYSVGVLTKIGSFCSSNLHGKLSDRLPAPPDGIGRRVLDPPQQEEGQGKSSYHFGGILINIS